MEIDRAKTAARWLGFGRDLLDHPLVGYCLAASFFSVGSGNGDRLVPRCDCRLRSGASLDRLGCVRLQPAQCAPCDFGADRHAARVGDLSARTFDLAKNSPPGAVGAARAMGNVRPLCRFHVHQGADRTSPFCCQASCCFNCSPGNGVGRTHGAAGGHGLRLSRCFQFG